MEKQSSIQSFQLPTFQSSNPISIKASKRLRFDFFARKKILITGHTGFKGAWLSRTLIIAGAKVYGYALKAPTNPNLFEILNLKDDMESITGDIRDYKKLLKVMKKIKPEIIFHLAAQPLVIDSYIKPLYTYQVNVMGTSNLLQACRYISSIKSIINITTDKVYLNEGKDILYKEDDKLCGSDPYSNSKSCSDILTYSYRKSFFNDRNLPALSVARSGNVIGGGDFAKYRIIPDCYKALKSKKTVIIRNPQSIRPYQYILDCIYGYLLLSQKQYVDKKIEGSYNFGPEKKDFIKNIDLVKLFNEKTGNKFKIIIKKNKKYNEAEVLKLDNTKAKKILNWMPEINIEKAIELTAQWYDGFLSGDNPVKIVDSQIKNYFNL